MLDKNSSNPHLLSVLILINETANIRSCLTIFTPYML